MNDEDPELDHDPGVSPEMSALFDAARIDLVEPARVERALAHATANARTGMNARWGPIVGTAMLLLAGIGSIWGGVRLFLTPEETSNDPRTPVVSSERPNEASGESPREIVAATSLSEPNDVSETPIVPPPSKMAARRRSERTREPTQDATSTRADEPPREAPLSEELLEGALLLRARRALDAAPHTALELTAEHARQFSNGRLAPERERIAIEALARLGRLDEARARAARFVSRWPSSPHRRAVERAVAP